MVTAGGFCALIILLLLAPTAFTTLPPSCLLPLYPSQSGGARAAWEASNASFLCNRTGPLSSFSPASSSNLVDACCLAAVAALLAFRRPEVTVGGDDGMQVVVHSVEVSGSNVLSAHSSSSVPSPLPAARILTPHSALHNLALAVHNLPLAVTFTFIYPPSASLLSSAPPLTTTPLPPQERDPIPLTVHNLPLAVTFAYFNDGNDVVRHGCAMSGA
ncbi:unnamed protein product [Closterium sp. NIES-65]|nr:unnamed protein product [Closterium sp. NIES-65]